MRLSWSDPAVYFNKSDFVDPSIGRRVFARFNQLCLDAACFGFVVVFPDFVEYFVIVLGWLVCLCCVSKAVADDLLEAVVHSSIGLEARYLCTD